MNFRQSKHKIKGFATLLVLLSQSLMICYDGIAAYVKYTEKFYTVNGNVLATPFTLYSADDKFLTFVANELLNVSWSLKSSSLFLALAVWNYAVCSMVNLKNFHKSTEFRSFAIVSFLSFCLYPTIMIIFWNDSLYSTVAPQFVYHMECFFVALIIIRTNRRFLAFLQGQQKGSVVSRIQSYIMLNRLIICTVLADGLCLFIVNVDIMGHPTASKDRLVYNNKLATDILTTLFSAGFVMTYPLVILNMHHSNRTPGKSTAGKGAGGSKEYDEDPRTSAVGESQGRNHDSIAKKKLQQASSAAQNVELAGTFVASPSLGHNEPSLISAPSGVNTQEMHGDEDSASASASANSVNQASIVFQKEQVPPKVSMPVVEEAE
jgi:hypothetical protein